MPEFTMPGPANVLVGRPRRYIAPEHVRELRRQGLSFREIARSTGFGYGTVPRAYSALVTPSEKEDAALAPVQITSGKDDRA
jgi:hypothetical protein